MQNPLRRWTQVGAVVGAAVAAVWAVPLGIFSVSPLDPPDEWVVVGGFLLLGVAPGALGGLLMGRLAPFIRNKGARIAVATLLGLAIGALMGGPPLARFSDGSFLFTGLSGAVAGLAAALWIAFVPERRR